MLGAKKILILLALSLGLTGCVLGFQEEPQNIGASSVSYTRDQEPRTDSTYSIGDDANEYLYGWFDNLRVGDSTTTNATSTNLAVSSLVSCDTIDTTADGVLICGTDGGGGGGASALGDLSDVATTTATLGDVLVLQADGTFDLAAQTGGGGTNDWQVIWPGTLAPTSTNDLTGLFVNASSTIAANFRVDGDVDITGDARVDGGVYASSTSYFQTVSDLGIRIFEATGGEYADIYVDSSGELVFNPNGADRVVIHGNDFYNSEITRSFYLEGTQAGDKDNPTYSFLSDVNTGMFSKDHVLSFAANGTEMFDMSATYASTTGYLVVGTGLGTLVPSAGDLYVSGNATTTNLTVGQIILDGVDDEARIYYDKDGEDAIIFNSLSDKLIFKTFSGQFAGLNFGNIATTDKTFAFPNTGGNVVIDAANNFFTGENVFNTASTTVTGNLNINGTAYVYSGNAQILGGQNGNAELSLLADEGDDTPDYWAIISRASNNLLTFNNNSADLYTLNDGGNSTTTATSTSQGFKALNLISCDTIDTDAAGHFVCGSDATGAGGGISTIKENNVAIGDNDITVLDFLGAQFNLAESPDTEVQIELAYDVATSTHPTGITAPTFTGDLTGNADTATALAANGTNASAGNAILGVDASGAAEGEFDVWTEAENTSAAYISGITGESIGDLSDVDLTGNAIASILMWNGANFIPQATTTIVMANEFSALWDTDFSATTTWAHFAPNFNTLFNATSTFGGNSATATALAANGGNCAAGEIALGVDTLGAVEGCYEPTEADITDLSHTVARVAGTHITLATNTFNVDDNLSSYTDDLSHTATAIQDGLIVEADLNEDSGTPTDEDILTYDSTGANFNWVAQSTVAAGTAAALAADPTDCAAGSYTLGINAAGTAQGCTDATTEIDSAISTHASVAAAHQALVTLAGTPDYLTLAGQVITRTKLDITDDTNATGGVGIGITTNDFTFDATEIDAVTWSDAANASNLWTFSLSGTNPTVLWEDAGMLLTGNSTSTATSTSRGIKVENLISCDTIDTTAEGHFVCGTDATGAGGGIDTIKENNVQVGDADIAILDFLGAQFDLVENPDTEIQIELNADVATSTHPTGITAPTFVGSLTGQADTVATITGLAPDTATTQATQAAITSASNLATVGTITSGTWQGGIIDHERGGLEFDASLITTGGIVRGASAGVMSILPVGADGLVLTAQADGSVDWEASAGGGGAAELFTTTTNKIGGALVGTTPFKTATSSANAWSLYVNDDLLIGGNSTTTGNFDVDGVIRIADGSLAAPSIAFDNDDNTGIYSSADNFLSLVTNGSADFTTQTGEQQAFGDFLIGANVGDVHIEEDSPGIATPQFSFQADENAGFFRSAADEIGLAVNGVATLWSSTASTTVIGDFQVQGNSTTTLNLAFMGEILPDGLECTNGQILKKTGANDWDCAADADSGGAPAWDALTAPSVAYEIDFAGLEQELNVENFKIGDGSAAFWQWDGFGNASSTGALIVGTELHVVGNLFASSTAHLMTAVSDPAVRIFENTGGEYFDIETDVSGDLNFIRDDGDIVLELFDVQSSAISVGISAGFRLINDTNTSIRGGNDTMTHDAGGIEFIKLIETTQDELVLNEDSLDIDLRVEALAITNALFVDGADGGITIGTITGTANNCLQVDTNGLISGTTAACGGAFDATLVDAVTWSDGANASNLWTFDVVGTDPTMLWESAGKIWTGNATTTGYLETGVVTNAAAGYAAGDLNIGNNAAIDGTLDVDGQITGNVTGALTGNADTVTTITGLAPDTATTQATQGAITSLGTLSALIGTGVIDFGGATSVEIPQDGTVNTAGEITVDLTTDTIRYFGGAERVIDYQEDFSFTVASTTFDIFPIIPIKAHKKAITITDIHCMVDAATDQDIFLSDGTNDTETVACTTSGAEDDGTMVNNTFTAREQMYVEFGTKAGTPNFLNVTVTYTIDAD